MNKNKGWFDKFVKARAAAIDAFRKIVSTTKENIAPINIDELSIDNRIICNFLLNRMCLSDNEFNDSQSGMLTHIGDICGVNIMGSDLLISEILYPYRVISKFQDVDEEWLTQHVVIFEAIEDKVFVIIATKKCLDQK